MLVSCADNVTLGLGNFGLQPTLLIPAPAVSNHSHLSGSRKFRTERKTDSVLIHLIECSPLIGPQIQRQAPIGPDTIYTRCRELSSLKLGHSLETCVRDCNCHIGGWAEAGPGNVKTYLLGTILVETLYESYTDTLNTSLIHYAFSFKWLISLFLNRS